MDETALMNLAHQELRIKVYWFLGFFLLMALLEYFFFRRKSSTPRNSRWPNNLGLSFLNTALLRFLFPSAAIGAAWTAAKLHFGLFNWVQVPPVFSALFTLVALDWAAYYQHRILHAFPLFWRIHRAHHTDPEVDVTTANRFHPLEVLLMMTARSLLVMTLGAPAFGVLLYEMAWSGALLWTHADLKVPAVLNSILGLFFVTPDIHLIHHSTLSSETHRNYGFIFSFWDRLMGTFCPRPKAGVEKMELGQDDFRGSKDQGIGPLIQQPFLDEKGRFSWKNLWQVGEKVRSRI